MKREPLTTKCRACGAEIMFIPTALYKKTPVDAEPVWVRPDPDAKGLYVLPNGGTIRGEIIGDAFDDEKADLKVAYVSHFSTCTEPERFRSRNKPSRTPDMDGII